VILTPPFPWFGGKRKVSPEVWAALGDVDNYTEPFAGSLAVLLGRPEYHQGTTETVNDYDHYLSNFWRALAADPNEVARWCDWPVNETDLFARHLWLVNEGRARIEKMESDPEFYDAKVAGWWVWGINAWIGGGWCSGNGPWNLGDRGRGVNRKLPHLGNPGQDKPSKQADNEVLTAYFLALAARLRKVRVCCGDWSRVVTDGALAHGDCVGVFLDPPYDEEIRNNSLYNTDGKGAEKLSASVRAWALAHGDDKRLRIVLCGYEGEHAMPDSWTVKAWTAGASFQTARCAGAKGGNQDNRRKERLWFSPHCLKAADRANLFENTAGQVGSGTRPELHFNFDERSVAPSETAESHDT
jgi:DNA adenine methylase